MQNTSTSQLSLVGAFLFASLLTVVITFYLLGLTVLGALHWSGQQLNQFLSEAHVSLPELMSTAYAGWTKTPVQTNGRTNILVLGLDSLSTRGDAPALTDTIMLLSIDSSTGTIHSLSLPRDLWLEEYATRINALYFYGQERYPTRPYQFSQEVMSDMTGVPIHYTVVMTLDEVARLIDIAGGVTVDVPDGFIDDQFPRPDVDVTVETDPATLYQTVRFEAGVQMMSGSRALEYIRSRKSEGEEGGDGARVNRQQLVIAALLQKMSNPQTLMQPERAGQLYSFYNQYFAQYIPMTEAIALGKTLWPVRKDISFQGHSLSIYPENAEGVLVHPPLNQYNGQWVYIIRDATGFNQEIKAALALP